MKRVYSFSTWWAVRTKDSLDSMMLEVKVKYKVLEGSFAGKDQSQRTYPYIEIQEAITDGRDVRWLLDKQLEVDCLNDYVKQTQGEEE